MTTCRTCRKKKAAEFALFRQFAVVLSILLGAAACAKTTNGSPDGSGSPPHLTSRPLGSSFVAVTGSGFSAGSPAVVTGTTPRGSTTINAVIDGRGTLNTSVAVPDGYHGPLTVQATAGNAVRSITADAGTAAGSPAADAGVRPRGTVNCSVTASVDHVPEVTPGDVVCFTGDSSSRLTITAGGTPGAPIVYSVADPRPSRAST